MKTIRVMSVFGTRPEAIKMCPLVQELSRREGIESLCCVTAQHRQMLDSVLEVFQVKPDWDLDIMTPRQTLSRRWFYNSASCFSSFAFMSKNFSSLARSSSTSFLGALATKPALASLPPARAISFITRSSSF